MKTNIFSISTILEESKILDIFTNPKLNTKNWKCFFPSLDLLDVILRKTDGVAPQQSLKLGKWRLSKHYNKCEIVPKTICPYALSE